MSGAGGAAQRRRPRLRVQAFQALLGVAAAGIAAMAVASCLVASHAAVTAGLDDLGRQRDTVASVLEAADDPVAAARGLDLAGARLTIVTGEGDVVYDSEEGGDDIGSHADRPEVREALTTGAGESVRLSATESEVMLYSARLLDDGLVIRLSLSRDGALRAVWQLLPFVCATLAALVAASAAAARALSRRLTGPLDRIDPMRPLASEASGEAYEEVVPLLRRIDAQHAQIGRQLERLSDNDRMRVEFTSNVTHELKTPLTTISGYAELIETGMAEPGDVKDFAGRIRSEAGRLTSLVDDILTLSRMDEAERSDIELGVMEPVDLGLAARAVAARLAGRAEELGVSLDVVAAGDAVAMGMPKLMDQIVYNLCDNALRYNVRGGSATVTCATLEDGRPYVRVADTGIGIAPENQEKVFNRFFRVDAGRSRSQGGTGLGLAIVKHAARCQGASVRIESALGEGTAITVVFRGAQKARPADGPAEGDPGQTLP